MSQRKRPHYSTYLGLLCGLFAWSLTACASSPPPTPTFTPAVRAITPVATATPQPGIQPLTVSVPAAPGILLPSPDGAWIASLDSSQTTLTIYDLTGQAQGQYTVPVGQDISVAWLPDSSALFAWEGSGTASGPLMIVDRHGNAQAMGISAGDPFLSPDGQWVAATDFTDSIQQDEAMLVPRAGGPARVLAQGSDVLGWQANQVVYWAGGSLYTVAPPNGSPQALTQVPGGEYLRPLSILGPIIESPVSPDGQVLVVDGLQDRLWMLAGSQLQRLPNNLFQALPVLWVAPHEGVGTGGTGNLAIVDVTTGAVVRDTGISMPGFQGQAVAGQWIAGTAPNQPGLFVINDETKAHVSLGSLPVTAGTGKLFPLGSARFLVYNQGGGGSVAYIVDPALASGG